MNLNKYVLVGGLKCFFTALTEDRTGIILPHSNAGLLKTTRMENSIIPSMCTLKRIAQLKSLFRG